MKQFYFKINFIQLKHKMCIIERLSAVLLIFIESPVIIRESWLEWDMGLGNIDSQTKWVVQVPLRRTKLSLNYNQLLKLSPFYSIFKQLSQTFRYIQAQYSLHKTCLYLEFFWSVFSPNAGKYGPERLCIRTFFT